MDELVLIRMTEVQRRDLLMLLERVQLSGKEAPAFMGLVHALNSPIKEGGGGQRENNQK